MKAAVLFLLHLSSTPTSSPPPLPDTWRSLAHSLTPQTVLFIKEVMLLHVAAELKYTRRPPALKT